MVLSYEFFWFYFKRYLENLKYNVKRACMFHLILFGILSILIFSVKNRGVGDARRGRGGGLLNGQNPLSMTKVIC